MIFVVIIRKLITWEDIYGLNLELLFLSPLSDGTYCAVVRSSTLFMSEYAFRLLRPFGCIAFRVVAYE